jgi:hypothetical protein
MTVEKYYETIICLERFNKTVNRLSSSTYDDVPPQGSADPWKEDELQSVRDAGKFCKGTNTLFERFADSLKTCNPSSHLAMVHLTGFRFVDFDMLLSLCPDEPRWRRTMCIVPIEGQ